MRCQSCGLQHKTLPTSLPQKIRKEYLVEDKSGAVLIYLWIPDSTTSCDGVLGSRGPGSVDS
eukprot:11296353-Ditylum_brightwellii.AAC.1